MAEHIDWDAMFAKVKLEDDAVGEIKPVLKPCPFCGGEAFTGYAIYDYNYWGVSCKGCGAYVPSYFPHEDTEESAIEAWNRRSDGK